ncbi:MAG: transporter [Hyphomicrobiales bacterium]|nr:transporter [Hyphomicrobiales bacterium]
MPSADEIHQYLHGAWRMMLGKADGLKELDLSVDGFWNSFFAIVVALPALVVNWVTIADSYGELAINFNDRFAIFIRLAVIDLAAWLVPLAGLAAIAPTVRLADRFVHYVVASNWTTAIIAWLMVPPAALLLVMPDETDLAWFLSMVIFIASQIFVWRMTKVAIGKGAAVAGAVYAGMLAGSIVILIALQWLLGLT